eukprot:142212-Prorocentrum_minimum.AAC.2
MTALRRSAESHFVSPQKVRAQLNENCPTNLKNPKKSRTLFIFWIFRFRFLFLVFPKCFEIFRRHPKFSEFSLAIPKRPCALVRPGAGAAWHGDGYGGLGGNAGGHGGASGAFDLRHRAVPAGQDGGGGPSKAAPHAGGAAGGRASRAPPLGGSPRLRNRAGGARFLHPHTSPAAALPPPRAFVRGGARPTQLPGGPARGGRRAGARRPLPNVGGDAGQCGGGRLLLQGE